MSERLVIVGAGLAAARAVEAARGAGFDGEILLVGEEPRLPYERPPLSKEWLVDASLPEEPAIVPAATWDDWRVDRALGVKARSLEPGERTLVLADGRRLRYDRLLITTGARPRRLSAPGADLDGVRTLRTLPDAAELRARLRAASRVVVVGAGLVGLEVAAAARTLGRAVTLVEADTVPLRRLLGPAGRLLGDLHRDEGVDLRLGATVAAFEGRNQVEAVRLATGERVLADLVVVGIGVAPDVGWLAGTGLDDRAGIVVDPFGRTAIPDVYAAGDVARTRVSGRDTPLRVESYANAAGQGAAAGRALAGSPTPWLPGPGAGSTQYGRRVQVIGEVRGDEAIVVRGDAGAHRFVAFYLRGGRVTATFALDRAREVPTLRALVAARAAVPEPVLADPSAPLAPWIPKTGNASGPAASAG